MSQKIKYLDAVNKILVKIKSGKKVSFSIRHAGFSLVLHQLIQEYYQNPPSQQVIIRKVLVKSKDLILSYLLPINFQKLEFPLLPIIINRNTLWVNDTIAYDEGDLQIAFLLLKIAIITKDEKLYHLANMMASVSKVKEIQFSSQFLSPDFKTGAIGIALLYQSMYFLTKIELYNQQANDWYVKSKILFENTTIQSSGKVKLDFNRTETLEAFKAYENPQNDAWRRRYFLEYDRYFF
jgi:hypothetical protein